MTLYAGTAKTDITPPVGTMMAAFPRKRKPVCVPRKAQGIHDPLSARALALRQGDTTVVLCSADLCTMRNICVKRIRDAVTARRPDLPRHHVLINVSHTHSGPEVSFLFGGDPDMPFVRTIEENIAEAALRALDTMKPVTMSWAKTTLQINHNRRVVNEDGKSVMQMEYDADKATGCTDRDLHVIRFDDEAGTPAAVVYHFTAHALTLGPGNEKFSADYPGYASRLIEEACSPATAHFLNGAAGNIHPRECMRDGTDARDRIGQALGDAVVGAFRSCRAVTNPALAVASESFTFQHRLDPSLAVPVESDILKIGPLVFGLVPGEFFVEHQLAFKEAIAPRPGTLVGYANGWPGYVPTEKAYEEGGYGVDAATEDIPEYCRTSIPPGAGETIIQAMIRRVLQDLPAD